MQCKTLIYVMHHRCQNRFWPHILMHRCYTVRLVKIRLVFFKILCYECLGGTHVRTRTDGRTYVRTTRQRNVYTPPTRLNRRVASCRRRRCVLDLMHHNECSINCYMKQAMGRHWFHWEWLSVWSESSASLVLSVSSSCTLRRSSRPR